MAKYPVTKSYLHDLKNINYSKVNNNFFLSVSQWSVLALFAQGVSVQVVYVLGGKSRGGGVSVWEVYVPRGICPKGYMS